jgi:xanthine dehydrogenase accessory factor
VTVQRRIEQAVADGERAAVFTVIEGTPLGVKLFVAEGGEETVGEGPQSLVPLADALIRGGHSKVIEHEGLKVFVEIVAPPPRLVVFGAVDTAEALCGMAKLLGWRSIVVDARARFATVERLPSADEILVAWPDEALEQIVPDHQTAILVLTHDEKFDLPALMGALESDAFYIGALGARRNQESRRERLLAAGVTEEQLVRIAGPCGLDIGAVSQPETAISILAEALALRAGRAGGRLQGAAHRIHAGVE